MRVDEISIFVLFISVMFKLKDSTVTDFPTVNNFNNRDALSIWRGTVNFPLNYDLIKSPCQNWKFYLAQSINARVI